MKKLTSATVNGRTADVVLNCYLTPVLEEKGKPPVLDEAGQCMHYMKPIEAIFYVRETSEKAITFEINPRDILKLAEDIKEIEKQKELDYYDS